MRYFRCNLCGCTTYHQRQGHARDDISLVPLECDDCGLVQLSSFDHIKKNFYENSHMHDNSPVSLQHLLSQDREDSLRRVKQFRDIIEKKDVLDIGCGAGGFLLAARNIASSVRGVEPERQMTEHFRKHGLLVYPYLHEVPPNENVDVVTMFHVLEHIPDPLEALKDIRIFLETLRKRRERERERERERDFWSSKSQVPAMH